MAARIPAVINPVTGATSGTASASTAVAAHPIEENASAKVASRDEVWRRRNWLRRACTRNQSWVAVADVEATMTPTAVTAACSGEANSSAVTRENHANRDQHHFDFSPDDPRGRERRGRHQIGSVFARDRQPCKSTRDSTMANELSAKLRHSSSAGGTR